MPRNLELKVPFEVTERRRAAFDRLGAKPAALLDQVDTYFVCTEGRLKLREIVERSPDGQTRKAAELIAYARPNDAAVRASDYVVSPVADATSLKAALAMSLGVRVVVTKRRELLLWQNVRIHLDTVDGLGTFLEFEAVIAANADEAVSQERLNLLMRELEIDPGSAIAGSYSDLLMQTA